LYVRQDFSDAKVKINIAQQNFREFVEKIAEQHKPDLMLIDNLAHALRADYNNPLAVREAMEQAYPSPHSFNSSLVITAHPRKHSNEEGFTAGTLEANPEAWFDRIMGSSHFTNSTGSLWALERDFQTNRTMFCGGSQRTTGGGYPLMSLEKGEDEW